MERLRFCAPLPCMSGTSQDELLRERMLLADSLRSALEALQQAAPNGRDYQSHGGHMPNRFEDARQCHIARREALQAVLDSVNEEMSAIVA
jgi:mRNA-degrading endonuclease YafQ of YafQ-DinJ toxin-antitoxin module